jgi:L-lactate dehydrogenase complex protein LldF
MNHEFPNEGFAENSRRALGNTQLRRALDNALGKVNVARSASVASVGDEWQGLRDRAREVKEHTVNHLDHYLNEFASNVERQGGRVCWARDAAEANRYIAALAHERGVTLGVKGKSMMTEEIALNPAMAAAGIEMVETDLGEYIVQLAGERPSHINIPAVHKSRGDVADLFSEKLHVERTEEISEMTALARRILRERFASAGMGVTGVNFAVAETGTIVLVENEGNIRMTTTLPRVHVAVMSIEKVIPRFEDLEVFLPLLTRSASGQKMCSYVSFLNGIRQSPTDEGADEFHVVILDNGRVDILANPHLRESLYCIRCGACLNTCPVYHKIGGHAYGWVYPGPIGSVLTPQLIGRQHAPDLPFASSLCGACRDVCPIKINIPDMLLHLRHEIKETAHAHLPVVSEGQAQEVDAGSPLSMRAAATSSAHGSPARSSRQSVSSWTEHILFRFWAASVKTMPRYRRVTGLMRFAQKLLGFNNASSPLAAFLARHDATRNLPSQLAPRSFREQWPEIARANEKPVEKRTG